MPFEQTKNKVKVGVSACVIGQKVRFDGGHKNDEWVSKELSKIVEFVPVCPEVEMGLGVPRETLHLKGNRLNDEVQLIITKTDDDITSLAHTTSKRIEQSLGNLYGFILQKKSPSCGAERVPVYQVKTHPALRNTMGVFAQHLFDSRPEILLMDSGRLFDVAHRDQFLRYLFTMQRFSELPQTMKALVSFQETHKYLMMEYSPSALTKLGQIVANAEKSPVKNVFREYQFGLVTLLKMMPTQKRKMNTLFHVFGYLKKIISSEEKQFFLEMFEDYKNGHGKYETCIKLLETYVMKHEVEYLKTQIYFRPYPKIKLQE